MLGTNDTNRNLLNNLLASYEPGEWGVITIKEMDLIRKELRLSEMIII